MEGSEENDLRFVCVAFYYLLRAVGNRFLLFRPLVMDLVLVISPVGSTSRQY